MGVVVEGSSGVSAGHVWPSLGFN